MTEASQPCTCGRIDVHAHFLPDVYIDALRKAGVESLDGGFPIPAWNAAAAIETMDRQGIDTAIVSLSTPATNVIPEKDRAGLAREVNEAGARLVRDFPGRFGFFATLPMPDVDAAMAELKYALDTLGADGIILLTHSDGQYLGNPAFAPIFAELNRRAATLFVHPTSPACYEAVALGRLAALIEFPIDTTRAITDLIYTRTLQTNPHINVVVPHGGAALPALAARIALLANSPHHDPRPTSDAEVFETLARLFYDTAIASHPVSISALRNIAPISQILYGSDWPFVQEMGVAMHLRLLGQNGLSESDMKAIAHENAERILPRIAKLRRQA